MVNARHMLAHLAAGEQQVLSSPDVVESFATPDMATNLCHRKCHGILNNHECSRQLLNTIPARSCADANSRPLFESSRANFGSEGWEFESLRARHCLLVQSLYPTVLRELTCVN